MRLQGGISLYEGGGFHENCKDRNGDFKGTVNGPKLLENSFFLLIIFIFSRNFRWESILIENIFGAVNTLQQIVLFQISRKFPYPTPPPPVEDIPFLIIKNYNIRYLVPLKRSSSGTVFKGEIRNSFSQFPI